MKVTTSTLSGEPSAIKHHLDPSLVKIEIAYPKGFEGERFFADGDIKWVSRETADQFIALGIAKEVEREADETPAETGVPKPPIATAIATEPAKEAEPSLVDESPKTTHKKKQS